MACIGCLVGAGAMAVIYGSGKLVEVTSAVRRDRRMRKAMREDEAGVGAASAVASDATSGDEEGVGEAASAVPA
jgi:hypothetical protein